MTGDSSTLSSPAVYALAHAYQLGRRRGRREVGTEFVLFELVRRSALLPRMLGPLLPRISTMLDQLSDDRGENDASYAGPGGFTEDVKVEAESLLREAQWQARVAPYDQLDRVAPAWTEGVRFSVRTALAAAAQAGVAVAAYPHLGYGILSHPDTHAYRLLDQLGIDVKSESAGIEGSQPFRVGGDPVTQCVIDLRANGALDEPASTALRAVAGVFRLLTRRWNGPVMFAVRREALRQAVRRGADRVDQASVLLAICAVEHQLRVAGRAVRREEQPVNASERLLRRHNVNLQGLTRAIAGTAATAAPIAEGRRWRTSAFDPRYAADATEAFEAASQRARSLGREHAGTLHLLAALLARPEGSACQVLTACGVDLDALHSDVEAELRSASGR